MNRSFLVTMIALLFSILPVTSSIHAQGMIPESVLSYLETHHPGFEPYLPSPEVQEEIARYYSRRCGINIITGDFDGDQRDDHALLLMEGDQHGRVSLKVLLQRPEGFEDVELGRRQYASDFSLCLQRKGERDFDYTGHREIIYENDAISWGIGEKAATCYEDSNGTFRKFTCSD